MASSNSEALENMDIVRGSFSANGQFQIVIGQGTVDKVYAAMVEVTGIGEATKSEVKEAAAKKQVAIANGNAESMLVEAKAKAESNKLLAQSITKDVIYLQLIQKWDGVLPHTVGGSNMMIPFKP